ncbi:hypothetical protein E1B28_010626 [Marasmius oreades]|uniref:Glycosyl hydrolase family 30 TIM-barrel domain-containing protein n=1 Tax=Marasmius oreades TaxID=181124 RepID=A0A9P7URB9_9AGAR|nr:uncharacterized protein E1B28_010626 [Marasmius oreades]KAG7091607.1 hypothetical protein E1B28_010626 [Marasmius oreades]
MRALHLACLLCLALSSAAQQIHDVWQTTWDRSKLFTNVSPTKPINFTTSVDSPSVKVHVDDTREVQEIVGFGATLTDISALTLTNMKVTDSVKYWELLKRAFDVTYGSDSAGLNYLRVPLGATDFSSTVYSLDDTENDTNFRYFDVNRAPSYVFSTLKDIRSVNEHLKVGASTLFIIKMPLI